MGDEAGHIPDFHYMNADSGIRSWFLTTDHKRIGILYLLSMTLFFVIGGVSAMLIRLELLTPPGDLVQADTYNKLFTIHGVVMVWFFLIPSIPTTLGNFLVPMMIGARDLAFPRLNLASWWVFNGGGFFTLMVILFGGVDTGWTFYTPYSSTFSNTFVTLMASGIFISGFSSIMTGLNFIVTVHKMRAPGLTWFRLPLFIWAIYATSLILVLATPVLSITLVLIAAERLLGIGVFDPALGGDPLLYQHLFWFYSHPAVYIMILPGLGVISEVVACFSRNRIFGYTAVAFSSMGIALLGFLVWGHHMFVAGQSTYGSQIFAALSILVAIPSAIKIFNWTATLYKAEISLDTPMLYALGFVGLFLFGGLTGLFLTMLPIDIHVHDTYFVIAHFHYIMVGGMVTAYLAAVHFWFPKATGKLYPEWLGRLAAVTIFLGFNLTFFPQFLLGYLGNPRRYHEYAPEFQIFHVFSTAGSSILAAGYVLPLIYLGWAFWFGKNAGNNPWRATGLEWHTPSPPPTHNFHETPVVSEPPYAYDRLREQTA